MEAEEELEERLDVMEMAGQRGKPVSEEYEDEEAVD